MVGILYLYRQICPYVEEFPKKFPRWNRGYGMHSITARMRRLHVTAVGSEICDGTSERSEAEGSYNEAV